jgi:hypothetical protein
MADVPFHFVFGLAPQREPLHLVLSPGAGYFFGINILAEKATPDVFGSDPSRPPFTGIPITIDAPIVSGGK